MQPDTPTLIVIYVSLALILIMFPLTWIARNVWHDINKTRLFAVIGVTSMAVFIVSVWPFLPD
jgi:hypothetical protein